MRGVENAVVTRVQNLEGRDVTAPAGRRSIFRRPPDIASTRSTYSFAKSVKMSDADQDVCILMTIGLCALIDGAARPPAAAPAPTANAPLRNRRRAGVFCALDCFFVDVM